MLRKHSMKRTPACSSPPGATRHNATTEDFTTTPTANGTVCSPATTIRAGQPSSTRACSNSAGSKTTSGPLPQEPRGNPTPPTCQRGLPMATAHSHNNLWAIPSKQPRRCMSVFFGILIPQAGIIPTSTNTSTKTRPTKLSSHAVTPLSATSEPWQTRKGT